VTSESQGGGLRFGIVLFDGVEELDWVGPWEVLTSWKALFPEDQIDVFTLSPDGEVVNCAKGARMLPDHSYVDHPPIDVLIYPGGRGTRLQLGDNRVRSWVREIASSARLVASVCTGALVLADAGLLDGRPATTHWASVDLLQSLGKDIDVRASERFVDDGNVVTSAGISAGIDMALHLVARLGSLERARRVRRQIQYDPGPPV
jgi:transcriptional regulator GlxA family with amidase domain